MGKDQINELPDLGVKNIDPGKLAGMALENASLLNALLEGISPESKKAAVRENSYLVLNELSVEHPEILVSQWGYFFQLLKSDNSFSKAAAIHIIANIVKTDQKGMFEKIFGDFYSLLDDESVMVASHVAGVSGGIARAKPGLQSRITQRLLHIDKTHFDSGRKDLIKAYALEALDQYYEESSDKERIIVFAGEQLNSSSPKARKLAKTFLKKRGVAV